MAVFYCHPCGRYIDDDYNPGEESRSGDLICPDCFEIEEQDAEDLREADEYGTLQNRV